MPAIAAGLLFTPAPRRALPDGFAAMIFPEYNAAAGTPIIR
jgi:hypothetical protein